MTPIQAQYHPTTIERDRYHEDLRLMLVEVLTVDWERKNITAVDLATGMAIQEITIFPAAHSSFEATDVHMPEQGSRGLAVPLYSKAGFFEVAIIAWVTSDTNRAQQATATRAIDIKEMEGWNQRTRGTFRKAWPGTRTATTSEGFSEKHDDGWDRVTADFSRDHLDPHRRTWTGITSRKVGYNDGGLSLEGPISRPGATGVGTDTLPDGTTQSIVYLAPGATVAKRYQDGAADVIALVERTNKVQEYALDYGIPEEIIGSALLDAALGVTADPWGRTVIQTTGIVAYDKEFTAIQTDGQVSHDDQSFMVDQAWDHPYHKGTAAVGPTLNDGPTPRRRGYILEHTEGTLVGSNIFDPSTYGQVLKPTLFPYTTLGRFGTDVESGYLPVKPTTDHVETRLAASASATRFTHEGNTTRWDITKEGFMSFEIGSTLPKENIPLDATNGVSSYEHPHGSGRSLEAHLVGSLKLVVGKNRDEEDAIDLQALGQTVLRLGADDASVPNVNRSVLTQVRGSNDLPLARTLQYWDQQHVKLVPGDAVNLQSKVGAENISLRGAFDGGTVLRLGARNPKSRRRHMVNGYMDGPGVTAWAPGAPNRIDSKSAGRPTYSLLPGQQPVGDPSTGDSTYAFHDLTKVGTPQMSAPQLPYYWSGAPVSNMDAHGLSMDLHAVQDVLLRIGKNTASGQSLLLDLAGGMVAAFGKDNQGRSATVALDGGVELTIGPNQQGKALRIEFRGDVDWTINGNFHLNVTGETVFDSMAHTHIVKTSLVTKAQTQTHVAMATIVNEAPEQIDNQGLYSSAEDA